MLLSSPASAADRHRDHAPRWLLSQLRVAGEPINATLLTAIKRCALAACTATSGAALPAMDLSQVAGTVFSKLNELGKGCCAAALAAFYVLLIVDNQFGVANGQVRSAALVNICVR
jgi:hypothetical protein